MEVSDVLKSQNATSTTASRSDAQQAPAYTFTEQGLCSPDTMKKR